jgi:hypothetical protein
MTPEVSFNLAAAALYPGVAVNLAFTPAVYHYHYCESRTSRSSTATKKEREEREVQGEVRASRLLTLSTPTPAIFVCLPTILQAKQNQCEIDRKKGMRQIVARSTLPDESCASEDLHATIQYISCLTKGCRRAKPERLGISMPSSISHTE